MAQSAAADTAPWDTEPMAYICSDVTLSLLFILILSQIYQFSATSLIDTSSLNTTFLQLPQKVLVSEPKAGGCKIVYQDTSKGLKGNSLTAILKQSTWFN